MPRRNPQSRRRQKQNAKVGRDDTSAKTPASTAIIVQPRYRPVVNFSRTVNDLFDINCDGINPSLGIFIFTLNDLPSVTDFSKLFQMYKITKIDITFKPEYTELTDAALVSNAVNVNLNTAIQQTDSSIPGSVDDVLQFQSCKSTGITKQHHRSFTPVMLTNQFMPCHCIISTSNTSERHYGLAFGVPPTGVAMRFRSTVVYTIQTSGAR